MQAGARACPTESEVEPRLTSRRRTVPEKVVYQVDHVADVSLPITVAVSRLRRIGGGTVPIEVIHYVNHVADVDHAVGVGVTQKAGSHDERQGIGAAVVFGRHCQRFPECGVWSGADDRIVRQGENRGAFF
jgi:hypothetical protein